MTLMRYVPWTRQDPGALCPLDQARPWCAMSPGPGKTLVRYVPWTRQDPGALCPLDQARPWCAMSPGPGKTLRLEQDEVVAMHYLALVVWSELAGQVVRGAAQQPRQFGGVVVDQTPGDGATDGVAQVHGITVTEPALDPQDAGWQQRLTSVDDGCHRAVVKDQPTAGSRGMRQPEQSTGSAGAGGHERRADVLAGHGLGRLLRRGQDGGNTCRSGNGSSLDLGGHPACTNARARTRATDLDVG